MNREKNWTDPTIITIDTTRVIYSVERESIERVKLRDWWLNKDSTRWCSLLKVFKLFFFFSKIFKKSFILKNCRPVTLVVVARVTELKIRFVKIHRRSKVVRTILFPTRFQREIDVLQFSSDRFPFPPKQIQSTKNVRDGGRNKSNRFPMNNSAFVSSCLETLFFLVFFVVFRSLVFIPSWQRSRQGGFTRVDRVVFVDIFVSPPARIRKRDRVTSTDYVYARLCLGYANVFPRKIASFVSHLRHADASICPTPSKSFHSDFLHPSIFNKYNKIHIYIYTIAIIEGDISTNLPFSRFSNLFKI